LPTTAALIRALSQGFTKIGFADIPSPYFAALVGYSVSAVLATVIYLGRGEAWPPLHRRPGLLWFSAAGFINAGAIALLYVALRHGELVVVGPAVATYPVFTLLLSALWFRQELITWRKIAGVALVVPGVVLIASKWL
jgi:drug/metabolite transporter (DMT)-like permease